MLWGEGTERSRGCWISSLKVQGERQEEDIPWRPWDIWVQKNQIAVLQCRHELLEGPPKPATQSQ